MLNAFINYFTIQSNQTIPMKYLVTRILPLVMLLFAFSCTTTKVENTAVLPDPLASHIDTSVKPGDDFFLYANGKWFKDHPIPSSEQSNGLWQLIQDTINAQVRTICESSASSAGAERGSNKQKIGDFFFSGMDSVALNAKGMDALRGEMA